MAGGHAIEAFSGVRRPHGDLDPSIPRGDLPHLRRHFAGRLDLWCADQERLTLLLPDDPGVVPELRCENVWARRSGADPWLLDTILMTTEGDDWVFKRDSRIRLPLARIVWHRDGVPYLLPEVQLLHKANGLRPKDQGDFDACRTLLDAHQRRWLREALGSAHPGHPWIEQLG